MLLLRGRRAVGVARGVSEAWGSGDGGGYDGLLGVGREGVAVGGGGIEVCTCGTREVSGGVLWWVVHDTSNWDGVTGASGARGEADVSLEV